MKMAITMRAALGRLRSHVGDERSELRHDAHAPIGCLDVGYVLRARLMRHMRARHRRQQRQCVRHRIVQGLRPEAAADDGET